MSKVNPKYLKGLDDKQKKEKIKNIKETRELLKKNKKTEAFKKASERPTNKKDKKESSFTIRFKKKFPDVKPLTQKFAQSTGIPLAAQREVFKKGKGAYASAGSRASVSSPEQWAFARLYSFYFNKGKTFDQEIVKKYKIKFK
tara:strand:- start:1722 stop:2150 length:429 start_codon:yes stop_codon:yes gene_type:complete